MNVFVTRRARFSAAHRLYNPAFSDAQNDAVFGKCNNPNGHGHNYTIDVTVAGAPARDTGFVIDLKELEAIIEREVIEHVDHKNLNVDVPFLAEQNPTAENIAIAFWSRLVKAIPNGTLHSIKVFESDNNFVEYFG